MKKIINNKDFRKGFLIPILITGLATLGWYTTINYLEHRDERSFRDGYEVGRYDQLNEDAEEHSKECFNLSKNPELNTLLQRYFKECKTARIIYAIAQAESSGKQFAVGQNDNGTLDGGWLQVNSVHRNKGETQTAFIQRMHDLEQNIALAKVVYEKQGFRAWVTYNNNKYKEYLK